MAGKAASLPAAACAVKAVKAAFLQPQPGGRANTTLAAATAAAAAAVMTRVASSAPG
mgnify:CR=1 FL=1